ncbi:MAG: hypothetical protein GQ531_09850 [Sulfurovum sp.]|nr:hypothetical protein [Sulfurovum sp.]
MKIGDTIKWTAISLIILIVIGCEDKGIARDGTTSDYKPDKVMYAEVRNMPIFDDFTHSDKRGLIELSSRLKLVDERVKKVVVTKREDNLTEAEVTYYSGRGEYVMKYSGSGKTYTSGMSRGGIKGANSYTTGIVLRSSDNKRDALILQRYCYGRDSCGYALAIIIND